ncbi:MAG: molybdopterin-guanine dinucleotide biosynthesis protein B [Chloroflexota bacterium]|nr:molybdopterin-guanine dinucleotide biosynthesis protein B [Chloroflexota bacterium]
MMPVVSIVGQAKSGKTTLIEKLIPELKSRGYRVATVKHTHQDLELDTPGKDSWRYARTGSDAVVISTPKKLALIESLEQDASIKDVIRLIGADFDILLVEGFHDAHVPKIEVHRAKTGKELRCSTEEIKAIVTDEHFDVDLPQFTLDDTAGIIDFIESRIVGKRGDETILFVNGEPVTVNRFAQDIFAAALLGMVSTLKGIDEVKSLEISIRKKVG